MKFVNIEVFEGLFMVDVLPQFPTIKLFTAMT